MLSCVAVAAMGGACSSFSESAPDPDAGASIDGGAGDAQGNDAGAPPDASADDGGPRESCATRADKGMACADFDDSPTPLLYQNGFGVQIPAAPGRQVRAPSVSSPPNALWIDAIAGAAPALTVDGKAVITSARVTFAFTVDAIGPTADGALVRFGIAPTCYVDVVLQATGALLQTHCGQDTAADWYRYQSIVTSALPLATKIRLALDVDYAGSKGTVTFDGGVKTSVDLNPTAKVGGKPYVAIGGIKDARIAVDDVLVTAR